MRWMRSFLVMQVVVKSFPKIEKYFSKNWVVEFISLSHWIESRINYIKNNVIWRINLSLLKMKKLEKYSTRVVVNWLTHLCPVRVYSFSLTLQRVSKGRTIWIFSNMLNSVHIQYCRFKKKKTLFNECILNI